MALNIDSSRVLRSPLELAALVQAVLAGAPNDESTWIEWKSDLDLSGKAGQVVVARQILGMANRSPEVAAQHAEGLGYIVIGAEPNNCGGVVEIDPANLDAALTPYLGPEGPRWSPQYVKVQGKSVLVITVDPPKRGDRTFTLQRDYDKYRAGAVFVRHVGRTDQAGPGDIRMLEDRYAATVQPIALHVRPVGADDSVAISPIDGLDALLDEWESCVREELSPPPPPPPPPSTVGEPNFHGLAGYELIRVAEVAGTMSNMFSGLAEEDRRTEAQFAAEVEQYVSTSRERYERLARARLAEVGASLLYLQIVNTSDRNYEDVRVELFIPTPVHVEKPELASRLPGPPERPRARGERAPLSAFRGLGFHYELPIYDLVPAKAPRFWIDHDSGRTTVAYDVGRVRAEQRISLDPVLSLHGSVAASEEAEISWTVTTRNVDGVARGALVTRMGESIEAARLIPELLPESDH